MSVDFTTYGGGGEEKEEEAEEVLEYLDPGLGEIRSLGKIGTATLSAHRPRGIHWICGD